MAALCPRRLSVVKRDWTLRPYLESPAAWSVLGNPGVFTLRSGPNGTGTQVGASTYITDANCAALNGFPGFSGTLPACYYNYTPFDNLVEETDQYQAYGEFNAGYGDTGQFHFEVTYARTDLPDYRTTGGYPPTSGPNGPGSFNTFSIPNTNPGFNTFLQQTGNGALIGTAQSALASLWRPIANGGNPIWGERGGQRLIRTYDELRTVAEVKGDLGIAGLGYDLSGTFIREYQNQATPDIYIDRLQRALNGLGGPNCTGTTPGANGCQYFNPFSNAYPNNPALGLNNPGYVSANANSTALVQWIYDYLIYKATQTSYIADGVVSGKLPITLPGGEIGIAVGGQFRKIDFRQEISPDGYDARITPCPIPGQTNCAFKTGPFIFLGQNIPLQLNQQVYAVFGELNVPVTSRLNAQLALRYEDYGGQTGSTTNPQFRGKWQFLDFLAVRGSVGTSFRGPTPGNVAPTGVTGLQAIIAAGNNFKSIDFFGNPSVGPEKAFTWSAGAILQTGGFTATVDYFSYRIRNQITSVPANIIATSVAGAGSGAQLVNCSNPLRSLITFNNNNACVQGTTVANDIARVRSDTTNGPQLDVRGIDIDLNYHGPVFGSGTFDIGGTASYTPTYRQGAFIYNGITVSPSYNAAGFANYDRLPGTVSKWRAQGYAGLVYGPHSLRWTVNYIDGVIDNRGPVTVQTGPSSNCSVANATAGTATNCQLVTFGLRLNPFTSHDFTYRVEVLENLTLTASILNAFDRDPPLARLEYSYDPYIGSAIGRSFKLGVQARF